MIHDKEAEYAIKVEKLTKRYGDLLAVNDISFNVRKGEVFALLGPNGAGKTTTVEIIETIRRPTSGNVRLLGMDVTKEKRNIVPRIGVLPQGFSSFDRITVRETMQFYSRLFRCRNTDIDGLIELVNLKDKAKEQYMRPLRGLEAAPRNRNCAGERPRGRVPRRADDRARPPRQARGVGSPAGPEEKGKDGISHHALHGGSGASRRHGRNYLQRGRSSPWTLPCSSSKATQITWSSRCSLSMKKSLKSSGKMGFEPVLDNHKNIKVRVEHTDDVRKILNAMKDAGASLLSLDVRKPNLEEVFLKLTGETLHEGAFRERGRNEPARRRRKSRREHQELLPREDHHVLHD